MAFVVSNTYAKKMQPFLKCNFVNMILQIAIIRKDV